MSEVSFSKKDVVTVAKALIEEAAYECNDGERIIGGYIGDRCLHCEADLNPGKHFLFCPVLVAQDLLTGLENNDE